MDTAGWFADVGIRILEGYGLTKTSPLIAVDNPQQHRIGKGGPVLQNVEVRFAPDGELEVRGPSSSTATGTSPRRPRRPSPPTAGCAPETPE